MALLPLFASDTEEYYNDFLKLILCVGIQINEFEFESSRPRTNRHLFFSVVIIYKEIITI